MGENGISERQSPLLSVYELINAIGGLILLITGLVIQEDLLVVLSGVILVGVTFLFFADKYLLFPSMPIRNTLLGIKATLTAFLLLYFSLMSEDFITGFVGAAVLLFGSAFLFSSEEEEDSVEQLDVTKNLAGIILGLIGPIIVIIGLPPINYCGYIIFFMGEGLISEYTPPVVNKTKAKSNRFLPGIIFALSGLVMFLFSSGQLLLFTDYKAMFSTVLGFILLLTGIYLTRSSQKKLLPAEEMQEMEE